MKIIHRWDYSEARRESYPPIGDQLDAIWKLLQTQQLTGDARVMLEKIAGVKARFPKG